MTKIRAELKEIETQNTLQKKSINTGPGLFVENIIFVETLFLLKTSTKIDRPPARITKKERENN